MKGLKKELYRQCAEQIRKRIESTEEAILSAQESGGEETKSSAGDKFETAREMIQQEAERNHIQLGEANKLMTALNRINPEIEMDHADSGSVVMTDNGNFYLSVSAGLLLVDGVPYMAISPASPIGLKLKGLKAGAGFNLNGKDYMIKSIG